MEPTSTPVRPRLEQVIDTLTTIVSESEGELVFVSCVEQDGDVGDAEAYASRDKPKASLPMDLLFSLPHAQGADTIMVVSRAAGPLESFVDSDLAFTSNLIDEATTRGIEVLDHILVRDGRHRGMRATTSLWS
jgi:hypothetical protein